MQAFQTTVANKLRKYFKSCNTHLTKFCKCNAMWPHSAITSHGKMGSGWQHRVWEGNADFCQTHVPVNYEIRLLMMRFILHRVRPRIVYTQIAMTPSGRIQIGHTKWLSLFNWFSTIIIPTSLRVGKGAWSMRLWDKFKRMIKIR